jgi:hypothetical protein
MVGDVGAQENTRANRKAERKCLFRALRLHNGLANFPSLMFSARTTTMEMKKGRAFLLGLRRI